MDKLISLQDAIKAIDEKAKRIKNEDTLNGLAGAVNVLYELPSVKLQEKTGHWITKIKSDLRGDMWPTNPKCSECGGEPYYSNTIYNYKFCPYCGAKMVEPQERSEE